MEIKTKSYTLRTDSGQWLAQIVLTSDGMFASVTDYGNLSFAWRHTSEKDFRMFLVEINIDYFAVKMYSGASYVCNSRKTEKACNRFAEKIFPALQQALIEDIEKNKEW